jgi:hypothetical protein
VRRHLLDAQYACRSDGAGHTAAGRLPDGGVASTRARDGHTLAAGRWPGSVAINLRSAYAPMPFLPTAIVLGRAPVPAFGLSDRDVGELPQSL